MPLFGGVNDYFPFTRAELQEFDPESHAALIDVWYGAEAEAERGETAERSEAGAKE